MSQKYERLLTNRPNQGWCSQSQLDAFFVYFDHTESCDECQKPGEGVPLDDGIQPTMGQCSEARNLWALYCQVTR
jgi:hypothetical protein